MMARYPVRRLALLALALVLLAGACNMTANVDDPTRVPDIVNTLTAVHNVPTWTPFAIPTASPNPTLTWTPAPTVSNCVPTTYWPVYTVQAGDTLSVIATLSGTTVQQLVQANCLTNPDAIFAGQRLYVPRLPPTPAPQPSATPTVTVDPNTPVFAHPLRADQHWIRSDGRAVTYYGSVRVTVGVVQNATLVSFYVNDPAGGSAIFIGQDSDPWDGAFVDYAFPAPGTYTFQAQAENEAVRISSTPFTVIYDPAFTPPGQAQFNTLVFTPNLGVSGGWVQLRGGATVTITWPDAPVGASIVEFTLAPTGTGMTPQVIGTDTTLANGAAITWAVPGGISAHVQANGSMPDGSVQQSQLVNVYAN